MGFQSSVNSAISTIGQAVGINKHIKEIEKNTAATKEVAKVATEKWGKEVDSTIGLMSKEAYAKGYIQGIEGFDKLTADQQKAKMQALWKDKDFLRYNKLAVTGDSDAFNRTEDYTRYDLYAEFINQSTPEEDVPDENGYVYTKTGDEEVVERVKKPAKKPAGGNK